jgi:hypothetical protein
MKVLITISRIIIGITFMFSGIVKAIDPLGSAYKFHDYFQAFNLLSLDPLTLLLSILLSTAEFISGFAVLSGYRQKAGIIVVMILMIIFTPLTLVLALTNPVSDCGCFGDAIHLTNWQTFYKNLFLMIFAVILFTERKHVQKIFSPLKEWILIGIMTAVVVIFALLNLRNLPLIDFLPYKPGVNINESMMIPEGMPADKYETTFIYEKDGVRKEFSLDNYPADDTSWVFIDQKSVLVKKGYQPPIHDFSLTTLEGIDLTDKILSNKGYTLLFISTKLEEADPSNLEKGFSLGSYCAVNGMDFYVVTASGGDVLKNYNNGLTFCTADEVTLKTIVRANPGYLLINSGSIVGKWSWATVPAKEKFITDTPVEHYRDLDIKLYRTIVIIVGLSVIILLMIPGILRRKQKQIISERS